MSAAVQLHHLPHTPERKWWAGCVSSSSSCDHLEFADFRPRCALQTPRITPSQARSDFADRQTPAPPQLVDGEGDARLPAPAAGVAIAAGGEHSPVAQHAALALLHRRLLCTSDSAGDDSVELSPVLRENHLCVCPLSPPSLGCAQLGAAVCVFS
jgi:hypothetical protein